MRRKSPLLSVYIIARLVIVLSFGVLVYRLWQLQLASGARFRREAALNRIRKEVVRAPRGVIYDRNGKLLAYNEGSFDVAVVPADIPQDREEEILTEVLDILDEPYFPPTPTPAPTPTRSWRRKPTPTPSPTPTPEIVEHEDLKSIEKQIAAGRLGSASRPIVIARKIPKVKVIKIEELSYRLPGVKIVMEPRRKYPFGSLMAQIVGFMGPIPHNLINTYKKEGYEPDEKVGLAGLEYTYEKYLRGKNGMQYVEVNVNGRKIKVIGEPEKPQAGYNLRLTIDTSLQKVMEEALIKGMKKAKTRPKSGVAIAMDPRSGAILGMVSLPTYDDNLFARGISPETYKKLATDRWRPMINHAISSIYPPGSTFKPVVAAAALQEKVITPRTRILDKNGVIWLPNKYFPDDPKLAQPFYCWIHKYGHGHGNINVREALAVSCDIFFYEVGGGYKDFQGLGIDRLVKYAHLFGYGEKTGIDLPGESPGQVGTPKWKRLNYGENWTTGDTYNMSIGQGYLAATPLQVLNATAAIANGGYLYQPQVVYDIEDSSGHVIRGFHPKLIRELPIDPKNIEVVREGMWGVVHWPQGTAKIANLYGLQVAGKTGTAEFYDPKIPRDRKGNLPTHAWFTAFAPYEDPEIALVVFVYNGGEGSFTAAPIARDILKAYFTARGMYHPPTPVPTPTATPSH